MGPKRVMWVRRYQGQCRALRPLGHQGCRLRNHNKDQPLCSGYTRMTSCTTLGGARVLRHQWFTAARCSQCLRCKKNSPSG